MKKRNGKKKRSTKKAWTKFESLPSGDPRIDAQPNYVGTFVNSHYQVQINTFQAQVGEMMWLAIICRDRSARHDWREIQRVKNELCGPESEAMELYPRESRLVDTNNQFHLFVFPKGIDIPFGYCEREVSDRVEGTSHKQRPFQSPPEDLNAKGLDEGTTIFAIDPAK